MCPIYIHLAFQHNLIPQIVNKINTYFPDIVIRLYHGNLTANEYQGLADNIQSLLTANHELLTQLNATHGTLVLTAYDTWRVRHGP